MAEQNDRQPDETIRREIERRLEGHPRTGNLRLPIDVSVQDGQVTLRGWTATSPQKHDAQRLARAVRGVAALDTELYVDDELQTSVGRVLALDDRLREYFPGIVIKSRLGHVTLIGYVATEDDRQAAEALARRVPGVRAVTNWLGVSPYQLSRLQHQ